MNYGNVYIIKKATSCSYKIGVSSDVIGRLKTLQIGCPDLLEIYKTFDCKLPFELEKKTHKEFKESRLNGEWFSFENIEPVEYYMEVACKKINDRMLICDSCNYETKYTQHYEKHLKSKKHKVNYQRTISENIYVKSDEYEYSFECPRCKKIFDRSYNLNRHLNIKKKCKVKLGNPTPERPPQAENICSFCDKTYYDKSTLTRHLKICKKKKENEKNMKIIIKRLEKENNEMKMRILGFQSIEENTVNNND